MQEATPHVSIRRLRPDDIGAVVAIEKATNPSPWTLEQFEAELHNPVSRFELLIADGEVAAFVCAWIIADEMEIQDVATAPAFQRRGYAGILLEQVLENARREGVCQVHLEVRVGNHAAQALYRKYGFGNCGIRTRYYSDNEDALLMKLELGQPPARANRMLNEESQ